MLASMYRQTLLGVANNPAVEKLAKTQGWKLGVRRFVAGETFEEALPSLQELEENKLSPILDLLGEFVDTEAGAQEMVDAILMTLDKLSATTLDKYMSVKPTQLGLGVSLDLALKNARRILDKAREVGAHICLDMENVPFVDGTLDLLETLISEGYENVSTVLQSYLKRTPADLARLLRLEPTPSVRIVKGAYKESAEHAYQDIADVNAAYRELLWQAFDAGAHVNVATHDESIISEVIAYVRGANLGVERYEFQFLFGVKPKLQTRLVEEGHTVRIYVPYGEDWYGYFSRRLAERPANLMFVVRGLMG